MITILINKITDILKANDLIQEVYAYEVEEFKGDPVAVVVPSGNESDYSTLSSNKRIYSFSVKLYLTRTSRPKEQADAALRDLVSSVLDAFDRDYTFAGLVTPQGYTMINVAALPSAWGYSGREDEFRVAEIVIKCRVDVDVTNLA